jgi:ABC-type multidrug transport system fused ATPase/permease subunit
MNKYNQYFQYFKNYIDNSIYILLFLMFVGAIFEVVGISLFLPLLSDSQDNSFPLYIKSFFDLFDIFMSNTNIAFLIIFIFTIKFIVINIQNYYIYKFSSEFMYKIKLNIMSKIYQMRFISFMKLGNDNLNNIFTKEIEKGSMSIRYFLQIWVNIIYTGMYFLFALYINYIIVIVAFLVGIFIVFFQKRITKKIIHYSKQIVSGNEKTNLIVLQILNNMKYLVSTNSYQYMYNKFEIISKKYSNNLKNISFLNSIPKQTPEFIGIIVISSIIIINELTIKENIVTVVFVGLLLYRTLTKFMSIQKTNQDFLINIGAIEKIIEVENNLTQNTNKIDNILEKQNTLKMIENIEFDNISLNINKKKILSNINLVFKRSNVYAIIGESGAGKSSLLNILTSLYDVNDGLFKLNNNDIKTYNLHEFQNQIGYVSQESVIFEGTIKDNIIFDKTFELNTYTDLLINLNIDKIEIDRLTMAGTNISGGQRQLIALARELYKKPHLLILDEFTSALDSITEKKVMSYLETLKKDMIIIIVAHRLSSMIKSDSVVLMEDGKIIKIDNFNSLYFKNDKFKIMCNNQNIFLESNKEN